ncbi:MAG: 3-oxoacyl-ACP reductase FabG [Balneolaceae bacterium]|nr:3-oxoacyl-ACP reductase FabG [Balneolaceae bacterium]
MNRLSEKVAIVTGGAQGIGLATVEKFIQEGAFVEIWDVNVEKGQAVLDQLNANGEKASFQKVNVTSFEDVQTAAAKTKEKYGKIDILINNAGITRDARLVKMTPEEWQQVIDVNLTGVFNCTKAVSEFMIEQNYGRIINASSIVGIYGNFGQSNYVATKSGVIGMTKVWSRELGRKGITVNAVAPGFIETEMIKTVPEKVIAGITGNTPLGRLGSMEDIANAYTFLASDEAAFISGITLSVDGGLTI